MEENKYLCPQCGTKMISTYEKPALNLTCPKCGCRIATTKWDDIDLDDTTYKITIKAMTNPQINQLKCVSKLTGLNFIQSRDILLAGGIVSECGATNVAKIAKSLEEVNIEFTVDPAFPW